MRRLVLVCMFGLGVSSPQGVAALPPAFLLEWGTSGTSPAEFDFPFDVALNPDETVYVVDFNNHRVQKFDRSGAFITEWGSQGGGDGQFSFPRSVAVGPSGAVFVADWFGHRIQKFSASGAFLATWGVQGSAEEQFQLPYGVATDSQGDVYVSDSGNSRVQKFDANGQFLLEWGTYGEGVPGTFEQPRGITVGPSDSVYVVDNHLVQKFGVTGALGSTWPAPTSAIDVAVDAASNVYVTSSVDHRVVVFDAFGGFLSEWGTQGTDQGEFDGPAGIAAHANGNVYVADSGNDRVQKFTAGDPLILAIDDVGNDQGRAVRIRLQASGADNAAAPSPVQEYEAYRRVEFRAAGLAGAASTSRGGWEFVGAIPAHVEPEYSMVVPTLADSTDSGIHWSVFFVRAATDDPGTFFDSLPSSGYSVDNLSPAAPSNVTISPARLMEWDEAEEPDFDYFTVYGSESGQFDEENVVVGFTVAPTLDAASTDFPVYFVTATDFAGNEGAASEAAIVVTTPDAQVTASRLLAPNMPNPSRARTTITFALPAAGTIDLSIYDVTGSLLRRLSHGSKAAGTHRVSWDGTDQHGQRVAPGTYFYRLVGSGFARSRRLVVVR